MSPELSLVQCRRLLLQAQAPDLKGRGADKLLDLIRSLGFVQVDSINVLERAHHLTLRSRLSGYRPEALEKLLAQRQLFEHWTHDASVLPVEFLRYWRYRVTLYPPRVQSQKWWQERLGSDPDALMARVLDEVRERGPMTSADFESSFRSGAWWGWKPEKVGLEYLWRSGKLAISGRRGFVKLYDLIERVFPEQMALPPASAEEYHDWAFMQALLRLGAATPKELAEFWGGLSTAQAQVWCRDACAEGKALPVRLEGAGAGVAALDWEARLEQFRPGRKLRILNPFDPVVRDRKRLKRLFDFDYSFEAYVPAPKRLYGYFVLPVLEGERFVARLDAKTHRQEGRLEVKGVWWEDGGKVSPRRRDAMQKALDDLAAWLGVDASSANVEENRKAPDRPAEKHPG